ncbi:hypothetical protein Sjap_022638 [Stephania japonica]|uniref:Uncharacterized protein n=1 Tax=Stephania japonica TaxID=461633 RepID=A0AAP0HUK9_9MAGN
MYDGGFLRLSTVVVTCFGSLPFTFMGGYCPTREDVVSCLNVLQYLLSLM